MDQQDTSTQRLTRIVTAVFIVLLVLALFPLTPDPAGDIKYLIIHWTVLVLAGLWFGGVVFEKAPSFRPSLLTAFVAAFLALNAVAALASPHVANSLHGLGRLAALALLYAAVARAYSTPRQAWRLFTVVCVAVAVSSLYGLCQRAGLDPFPWSTRDIDEYRGLPATFGNPNVACHALNIAFILAAALAFRKGTRWCALPGLVIGAHILLAQVRAVKVAVPAAAVLLLVALLARRHIRRPLQAAVTTCLIFIAVAAMAAAGAMALAKSHTGSCFPLDRSLLLRYHSFYGASKMILERPLLGYGPGNYHIENPPYWTAYERERFAVKRMPNKNVHNDFLEAAVDAGMPAAASYLGFIVCAMVYALVMAFAAPDAERRRLGLALAACFCAFAVDGLFGFNSRVPVSAALLFVLAGLVEGLHGHHIDPAPNTRRARFVATGALGLALVLAGLETSAFAGQFLFQRAQGAKAWGYPERAHDFLAQGERFAPWDFRFAADLGAIDLDAGRFARAVGHLERSLERNPHFVMVRVALAEAYWAQVPQAPEDDVAALADNAQMHANRALEICPALPEAHALLARIDAARARRAPSGAPASAELWRDAKRHAHEAIKYGAADRGVLQRLMAEAHEALGEVDEAELAYRRAGESGPRDDATWQHFHAFAAEHGRWTLLLDALNAALRRAEQKTPADAQTVATVSVWLAKAYREGLDDASLARSTLERALAIAPERLDVWGAYAGLFEAPRQAVELAALLNATETRLASENKPVPSTLVTLRAVLEAEDAALVETAAAVRAGCQERAQMAAESTVSREYAWLVRRVAEALRASSLTEAQRGAGLQELGTACLLTGDWERADGLLEEALGLLPLEQRAFAHLHRAEALSQLGRFFEAEELVNRVLRQAPGLFHARWQLARLHARAGWRTEARREYQYLLRSPRLAPETRRQIQAELDALGPAENQPHTRGPSQ